MWPRLKLLIEFMPTAETEVVEAPVAAILIHVVIATIDTIIIGLPLQLWNIFRQMASDQVQRLQRPQHLNDGPYIIVRLIFLLCNVQKIQLCAKPAYLIMICPQE